MPSQVQPVLKERMSTGALLQMIREMLDEPEAWLDAPNSRLNGERPRNLIGTPRQVEVEDQIRALQLGITS